LKQKNARRALGGGIVSTIASLAIAAGASAFAQDPFAGAQPERVIVRDYVGEAMEPFVSRDGRLLFFNTPDDRPERTDLLVAVRVDARTFRCLGPVRGANSPALDAAASMDRTGRLYFHSARDYDSTLSMLFFGRFAQAQVRGVRAVEGLAAAEPGRIRFDAEIAADGRSLYHVEGRFVLGRSLLWEADLFVARRYSEGRFARDARSERLFARLNTGALEYAPAVSADEREIFFTRIGRMPVFAQPSIWRATRPSAVVPFSAPSKVSLSGYVEAPSIAPDGSIYFHRRDEDGRYRLYRLPRTGVRR
jgi:hypothetical protein